MWRGVNTFGEFIFKHPSPPSAYRVREIKNNMNKLPWRRQCAARYSARAVLCIIERTKYAKLQKGFKLKKFTKHKEINGNKKVICMLVGWKDCSKRPPWLWVATCDLVHGSVAYFHGRFALHTLRPLIFQLFVWICSLGSAFTAIYMAVVLDKVSLGT